MDYKYKAAIESLTQGKEFAKQLQIHLHSPSSSSHQTQQILIHNILHSFHNSLSLLDPHSSSHLPRVSQHHTRKIDKGFEEDLDDGHSWRKYGQKEILGAKHPRGYYRCSDGEGCDATKQIQRSDEDPNMVNVTYRGSHTCNLTAPTTIRLPQPETQQNQSPDSNTNSNFSFPTLDDPLGFWLTQGQVSAAVATESQLNNLPLDANNSPNLDVDFNFDNSIFFD